MTTKVHIDKRTMHACNNDLVDRYEAEVKALTKERDELKATLDWSQYMDVCALPVGEQTNADAALDAYRFQGSPKREEYTKDGFQPVDQALAAHETPDDKKVRTSKYGQEMTLKGCSLRLHKESTDRFEAAITKLRTEEDQ